MGGLKVERGYRAREALDNARGGCARARRLWSPLRLHPSLSTHFPGYGARFPSTTLTINCPSPFDRIHGKTHLSETFSPPPTGFNGLGVSPAPAVQCAQATAGREHTADALGIGGVLLVGLSFLPRRRAPATRRLVASPV